MVLHSEIKLITSSITEKQFLLHSPCSTRKTARMSFREIRSILKTIILIQLDFIERMKVLGYPRLISMDSFRTPNFELVADILYWLVRRYDPSSDLLDNISTEQHRVDFLQNAAQIMGSKAQIKLKTAQLYRADGFAVRELLKIADVLFQSLRLVAIV